MEGREWGGMVKNEGEPSGGGGVMLCPPPGERDRVWETARATYDIRAGKI